MEKSRKDYIAGYGELMIEFQMFDIFDLSGNKIKKHKFFDTIYQHHYENSQVNKCPFILRENIDFILLKSDLHNEYYKRPRVIDCDFCEEDVYKENCKTVFSRKAGFLLRKLPSENITATQVFPIILEAIEYSFNNHSKLQSDIEAEFTKQGIIA